jgi:hypothetical protein
MVGENKMIYKINWQTRKLEKSKAKRYYKYNDAGHGWLRVHIKDIVKCGIENMITAWSYINGKYVYLEEDCDMSFFLQAADNYIIINTYTRKDYSRIRNFESYSIETLNNNLTLLEN